MTTLEAPPAPRPPRLWSVFAAYAVLWVCVLVGGVAVVVAAIVVDGSAKDVLAGGADGLLTRPMVLVASGAVSGASALGLALLGGALSPTRLPARLRTGPLCARHSALVSVAAVAGTLGVSQGSDSVISLLGLGGFGTLHQIGEAIGRSTAVELVLVLAVVGGLAPVAEELFFRGYLQTRLSQRWTRWSAILMTALLFGLLHADPVHTPFALLLGIYLGWVAEVTHSIRAALAGHLVNNLVSVSAERLLPAGSPSDAAQIGLLVGSIAVLLVSVVLIRRHAGPGLEVEPS